MGKYRIIAQDDIVECSMGDWKESLFKYSGNYFILLNEKIVYSGESQNVGDRLCGHRMAFKRGDNSSRKLQKVYNENNINDFSFLAFNAGADIIDRFETEEIAHEFFGNILLSKAGRQMTEQTKKEIELAKLKRMEKDNG